MSSMTSQSSSMNPGYTSEFDNFCCCPIKNVIYMLIVVDFSED
jgi:hypothetical protein